MKILHNQLQEAQSEYRAMKYPGDLAGEVLSKHATSTSRSRSADVVGRIGFIAALAVAASFVVLLWNRNPLHPTSPTKPTKAQATEVAFTFIPPHMPAIPSGSFTPPAIPAMPSLPSLHQLPSMPSMKRDLNISIFNIREQS